MENVNYVDQFVDDVVDGNNSSAKENFLNAISLKVNDALDQRKKEISQTIFNGSTQEEE